MSDAPAAPETIEVYLLVGYYPADPALVLSLNEGRGLNFDVRPKVDSGQNVVLPKDEAQILLRARKAERSEDR